jgi:ATP-dependent DNA ligase
MLTTQPTKYIYPPRPENCIPRQEATTFLEMGWKPQLKYNDTRCLIKILPGQTIELWNRHGEKIRSYNPPEWLTEQIKLTTTTLGLEPEGYHLLDGGLLDNKHQAIKDTIVIWDILVNNSQHLLGTTYQDRHNSLTRPISTVETYWYNSTHHEPLDIGIKLADNIILARTYTAADYDNIWDMVGTANKPFLAAGKGPVLEGVVLKDPTGVLQMGYKQKNNSDWMVKSRVETGRHRF